MQEKYFQTTANYFWQWEENNSLIAIPNGSTIAYKQYLVEILGLLSTQGLPSLGTILLAIIATNHNGKNLVEQIGAKVLSVYKGDEDKLNLVQNVIKRANVFLSTLSSLPDSYKMGKNRTLVLQAIFQNCHNNYSPKNARIIYKQIRDNNIPISTYNSKSISLTIINIDYHPLALLSEKFPTPDTIIEAIASLPTIEIETVEIETLQTRDDALIDKLIEEPKTFHVGSLIKSLWGGLNIPSHYSMPSQQPLGGVSDISNKGDFDRLLFSEFANDELLFTSRLVNNEALYINREVPPLQNDTNRIILIDISLRNWGTPKTISFAIMLALANHPKSNYNCNAYLVGNSCFPISHFQLPQIIEALGIVEPCLYPANGLNLFFDNIIRKNDEVIYITSRESSSYPEMKSIIDLHRDQINYLVYVKEQGQIDFYRLQKKNKKHIQTLSLDLENLWENSNGSKNSEISDIKDVKPLAQNDSPLLFIPQLLGSRILVVNNTYYTIFKQKLFKKVTENKGWEIIYDQIGKSLTNYHMGVNEAGEVLLLMCHNNEKRLNLLNLNTGEFISKSYILQLIFRTNLMYFYENCFYYNPERNDSRFWKIDLNLEQQKLFDRNLLDEIVEDNEKKPIYHIETLERSSVVFNLKSVAISNLNELIINKKHILRFSSNGAYFSIYSESKVQIKETAIWYNDNYFVFQNGVGAKHNLGMLNLTLKDGRQIHIPTVIDLQLAIAIDNNKIEGCQYFFRDPIPPIDEDSEVAAILKADSTWN